MSITKRLLATLAIPALALSLSACDFDVEDEGRLPDVDMDYDPGRAPDVDVRGPDIDVEAEEREITVPDVDVDVPEENEDGTID